MLEPMFIFINCYTAYLIAELLDLSAILSIIFCAFVMMDRSESEMSSESHVVVKYRFVEKTWYDSKCHYAVIKNNNRFIR
jgi:NhaP-type Na+/H+ or K+/H+ antiporter